MACPKPFAHSFCNRLEEFLSLSLFHSNDMSYLSVFFFFFFYFFAFSCCYVCKTRRSIWMGLFSGVALDSAIGNGVNALNCGRRFPFYSLSTALAADSARIALTSLTGLASLAGLGRRRQLFFSHSVWVEPTGVQTGKGKITEFPNCDVLMQDGSASISKWKCHKPLVRRLC